MKRSKTLFIFLGMFLVFFLVGNLVGQDKKLPAPEPSEEEAEIPVYTYRLSLEKEDVPGEYTRREIESFLCAHAMNFISTHDLVRSKNKYIYENHFNVSISRKRKTVSTRMLPLYYLRRKTLSDPQRATLEGMEINKWFEDRVTVMCKGDFSTEDLETVKYFVGEVNRVIGRDLFHLDPDLEVANIVVEFPGTPAATNPLAYVGEAACLEDNMRVVFFKDKDKMKLDTYKTGAEKVVHRSRLVKFTPAELEFRKKNRLIKVYITNILNPRIRSLVVLHELMHSVGFTGHSPYGQSNIYPVPNPYKAASVVEIQRPNWVYDRLSPLAKRMIELLYRPEILPGMTLKEAAGVAARLRYRAGTTDDEIRRFLENRKKILLQQKAGMLEKAERNWNRKDEIYADLFQLGIKKEKLTKEILEKENRVSETLVKKLNILAVITLNRVQVEKRLKKLEAQVSESEARGGEEKRLSELKRQVLLSKEDLEIWADLRSEMESLLDKIRLLEAEELEVHTEDDRMMERLRRVVRQLSAIEKELERLG